MLESFQFIDEIERSALFRVATVADSDALETVRKAIAAEGIYNAYEHGGADWFANEILQSDETGSLFMVIIFEPDEEMVGYYQLRRYPLLRMHHVATLTIFLAPEARNSGIGKRAVAHMIEWAREQGLLKIALSVHGLNERAIHLYERFGFEREGLFKRELCIEGVFVDSVKMCLFLDE